MANWIAKAIKKPGSFTKQANAAGEGVQQFAAQVTKPGSHASPTTKRRAVLAKTLGAMRRK